MTCSALLLSSPRSAGDKFGFGQNPGGAVVGQMMADGTHNWVVGGSCGQGDCVHAVASVLPGQKCTRALAVRVMTCIAAMPLWRAFNQDALTSNILYYISIWEKSNCPSARRGLCIRVSAHGSAGSNALQAHYPHTVEAKTQPRLRGRPLAALSTGRRGDVEFSHKPFHWATLHAAKIACSNATRCQPSTRRTADVRAVVSAGTASKRPASSRAVPVPMPMQHLPCRCIRMWHAPPPCDRNVRCSLHRPLLH